MAEETLADLFLAAGVRGQQRPRPLSMRPAWQRTPEANTPYRAPQQALADRSTLPYLRQETRNEQRQQNDLAQFALEHEAARNEVNTPPGTYLGQDALEMTGLPSVARGIGHLRDQEPGQALPELALGGLGVLGMAAGGGARTPRARPPMRAALPELPTEAPRLPNAPARLPGRATDGSVLPIRPPQPIRQSIVGGSNDLAEAAAMRPQVRSGLDAGPVQGGRQTREIPIAQATEASGSPFTDDVWEIGGPPITVEEVRAAMARGARREESFSHQSDLDWTRQDHIDRMATLARDGWNEPLELTPYGINEDGLHRLGAAIARGDQRIAVRQRQLSAAEQRELTADPRQLEAEHRARTAPDGRPVQAGRIPSSMRIEIQQPPGQSGSRYRLELDNQKNGFITVTDDGDVWRVNNSHLDPDLRNQGHGVRLYEDLVLRAREAGARTLRSDNSVSTEAQNAWMGLQRRGYPVTRIETPDGPRFEVDLARTGPNAGPPSRPRPPPRRTQ